MNPGKALSSALTSILIGVSILLPVGNLSSVLRGDTWWWGSVAVVAATLSVSALIRFLSRGCGLAGSAAAAIVWLWLGSALTAPGTSWLIFPTADTLAVLQTHAAASIQEIYAQGVPANESPALVMLIVMCTGLVAVLADAVVFAARMPALVGLFPLAVFLTPAFIRPRPAEVELFALIAACYLLVLWLAPRSARAGPRLSRPAPVAVVSARRRAFRNPVGAVGIGAAAIVLAITIPAITPGLTAASFADAKPHRVLPSIYSAGVDPTIQLGADLKRTTPMLSLSYTTTADSPLYLKLVNLTDLSERDWGAESQYTSMAFQEEMIRVPGLRDDVPRQEVVSTFDIASLRADWLPLPYPATEITGLPGGWLVAPDTLTVTAFEKDTKDLYYTVKSLQLAPTAAQLAEAGTRVPDRVRRMLTTPPNMPPVIAQTAAQVTAGLITNYDKAVALQHFFTNGGFRYSLTAPGEQGYDSSNLSAMAAFLQAKSGYCVHFATTMAMMARTLGIPARVAIGFHGSGPAATAIDGVSTHEVFTDDLHAWPELYFDGIGWLPFEPTPSLGLTLPDYSLPSYATASAATGPTDSGDLVADGAAEDPAANTDAAASAASVADLQAQAALRTTIIAGGILALTVLVLLAPLALRSLRRHRRLTALRASERPASIAWAELCDSANDYGCVLSPAATAREDAERIARSIPSAGDAIQRIVAAYERESYGRPGARAAVGSRVTSLEKDLVRAQRALASATDTVGRNRARFFPVSLLGGWRKSTVA